MPSTSYCTGHLHRHPIAVAAAMAMRAGFDGLDINGDGFERSPPPHVSPDLTPAERAEVAAALSGPSSALGANVYLVPDDPVAAARGAAFVRRSIDLAADLGVPFVHVFTGRQAASLERAEARRRLRETLAVLCEHAAARGVTLGVEGCAAHFVRSAAELLDLVRDLPGLDLRICFDPSHIFLHGEPVLDAAEQLFPHLGLVHVKDAAGRFPSFSCPPLGRGEMDWPALFRLLSGLGYDGTYAVEYEADQFGWAEEDVAALRHGRQFLRDNGI